MNQLLVNKITRYLSNQPIAKAWLFGSYAHSEENKNSDIDIIVNFTPGTKITLFKYAHILNDLQTLTGRKVDLVEEGQLKSFAINSANNDKILIYKRKN
jgi:hypothetical protein